MDYSIFTATSENGMIEYCVLYQVLGMLLD